jgi:tetratricopeptide (TPR) repeat protein
MRPAALLAVLLALPAGLGAQDDPHPQCAMVGWVPREILERPVGLREGVGRFHDPVTTSSPEAQALYDQGAAYLHSYVWIEAARSFRQALRADPELALAWVGLSRVFSGLDDPKAAREAVAKARALGGRVTARERRRIEARALQVEALDDVRDTARHLAYKKALDDALAADMGDAELWVWRGNAEEPTAAGRGQRGGAASVAFYQQALRIDPDHFPAHHYLIHSYETIGRIAEALHHGETYARLAPAIPHAHHMWGHDLRRVGRVADAIEAFKKAYDLEKDYHRREGLDPGLDWHHPHNLDLLATCYQHQGRVRTTEQVMREVGALPSVSEYREFNKKEWPDFLLTVGRSEESLQASRELAAGRWPAARLIGHVGAGRALLALGKVEAAAAELATAEKLMAELSPAGGGLMVSRTSVEAHVDGLRGELWLRTGKREEAARLLKDVQRRVRAIPGPDAWVTALFRLESIAFAAREAGDWELAAHTAEQMRDHDAAYGGTHYALGLVAEHGGDREAARRAYATALEHWKDGDRDHPALADAQARLAVLTGVAARASGDRR